MFVNKIFHERENKISRSILMNDLRSIINQLKHFDYSIEQIMFSKQVRLQGKSMCPTLNPYEISILLLSFKPKYTVGDIIVFPYANSLVGISVHRIVRSRKNFVITKGDNNTTFDFPIEKSSILGKVEKAIKKDGTLSTISESSLIAFLSLIEGYLSHCVPNNTQNKIHRLFCKAYEHLRTPKVDKEEQHEKPD